MKFNKRRDYTDSYLESDRDYLENNNDLAVALLDNHEELFKACWEVINNSSNDGCDDDLTVTTQSSVDKLQSVMEKIKEKS